MELAVIVTSDQLFSDTVSVINLLDITIQDKF